MNVTVSLESLWLLLSSLNPEAKKWLVYKLFEGLIEAGDTSCPYTAEEVKLRLQQVEKHIQEAEDIK